jgi:3-oxoacyl-[acyl-carrier protein] reductase
MREGSAKTTADEIISDFGVEPLVVHGDVSDAAEVKAMLRLVFERHGRLDALVVNAGVHEAGLLGMMSDAAVERLFAVNAVGAAYTVNGAVKLLRRGRSPSVVLLSSVMGTSGAAGQVVYGATKAAVAGFARAAAKELGPTGIRVNAVAPGFIATDMTADLATDEIVKAIPARRQGTPEEVAAAVRYLASDDAGYVTGTTLYVDGGMSA